MKSSKACLALMILSTIVSLACSIGALFIFGETINSLSNETKNLDLIFLFIFGYAGLKILSASINTVRDAIRKFFLVDVFKKAWSQLYPGRIDKEASKKGNLFFLTVFERIPQLHDLQFEKAFQITTAVFTILVFSWRAIADEFFLGFVLIFAVVVISTFGNKVYAKSYKKSLEDVSTEKEKLIGWVDQFFESEKKLRFNWKLQSRKTVHQNWFERRGQQMGQSLHQHAKVFMKRDLVGSLVSDWPYILGISFTMLSAAFGYLNVGEIIIWIGLTDYLVSANQAFRTYLESGLQERSLRGIIQSDLPKIREKKEEMQEAASQYKSSSFVFPLLDNQSVSLSFKPGFYQIEGGNGCGKSTLIDLVAGLHSNYFSWDRKSILALQSKLKLNKDGLRVIQREPVLFEEEWPSLLEQIFGPNAPTNLSLRDSLLPTLQKLFPYSLALQWIQVLEDLGQKIERRETLELSSGEKVLLSFARMLAYWDKDVSCIISDECESVLSDEMRRLFMTSLHYLSDRYAVLFVSHTQRINEQANNEQASIVSCGFIVGVDEDDKAHLLDYRILGRSNGSGKIEGIGNIGEASVHVLKTVKNALAHQMPISGKWDQMDYVIEAQHSDFQATDMRSAGLSFAISLCNLISLQAGEGSLEAMAATGRVLLDGSVIPVSKQEEKEALALSSGLVSAWISPTQLKDVRDIPQLLEQLKERRLIHEAS